MVFHIIKLGHFSRLLSATPAPLRKPDYIAWLKRSPDLPPEWPEWPPGPPKRRRRGCDCRRAGIYIYIYIRSIYIYIYIHIYIYIYIMIIISTIIIIW